MFSKIGRYISNKIMKYSNSETQRAKTKSPPLINLSFQKSQ